jgi:hypothetical protein
MKNITVTDYILLPFYLVVIYFVAYAIRNSRYPEGHPWRAYFIPGLTVKIIGAIFIGMLYEYYYNGQGDTFHMFFHSRLINASAQDSIDTWFRLITHTADKGDITDSLYLSQMFWYDDASTYLVACVGAFIGTICFTKYLPVVCILAAISFTGFWALFVTFAKQYPKQIQAIAIATLFLPGTVLWGSALFKDTLCMFAVGWITFFSYTCFEKGIFKIKHAILFVLGMICLFEVKIYILLAFFPLLLIKSILVRTIAIRNRLVRVVFLVVVGFSFVFCVTYVSKVGQKAIIKYSIQNIAITARVTGNYLLKQSERTDGSGYNLGNFEPTAKGILSKTLPAINVTLFRPYIWEARKPIVLLASLESLFMLLFTLKIIFTFGPFRLISKILADPNISFCLLFSLIFAFFVGISSYNFGTLSRYKIPCTPFYFLFLILVSGTERLFVRKKDAEISPQPSE